MLKLVKKLNFSVIFWIFFYIFLFGLLLNNSFDYLDTDLGWHLKVGEEISQLGSVPHQNHYNYTYTGGWVDHEWLANYLSFEIYNNFGYIALSVFFATVIILSLILLNILAKKYFPKTPLFFLAFLQLFGLLACLPHFGVRMQEFGFLFFILELWIICSYNRTPSARKLFFLWPLMYLWANMHASFLFGLGLLFVYIGAKFIELWLAKSRLEKYMRNTVLLKFSDIRNFSLMALGAALLTFATPYGPELYSFLSGYSNSFYLSVIEEWLPQSSFPHNYWQLLYLAFTIAIFGLFINNARKNKSIKVDIWQLVLVSICLYLSLKSKRHFPLMFAATFVYLIGASSVLFEFNKAGYRIKQRLLRYFIIACLLLAALNQFINIRFIEKPFESYCDKFPCKAAGYLKNNQGLLSKNIFNEYNWGGYLIWTYPEKKLFIDGRLPQTVYAGHTFIEEYLEFYKPETDYTKKLAQYDIELILLRTNDEKLKMRNWEKALFWISENDLDQPNHLRSYLQSARGWQVIYQDSLATIYKKNY